MRMKRTFLSMASLAMMAFITYKVYAACIGCPPPGFEVPCPASNRYGAVTPDGGSFASGSTGGAVFEIIDGKEGPGAFNTLRLKSFSSSGDVPEYGGIEWTGVPERTQNQTTIVSNTADGGFPGTGDIYMAVDAKLEWQPGRTFRSRTDVHVRNTNLQTWAPHENEVYTLVEPVEFEDAETGELAFTLTELTSVLN